MTWFARVLLGTLALVSPLATPAITTTPSSVIPAAEQPVFTYDAGVVHGICDYTTSVARASAESMPVFGVFVGFVAAEGTAISPFRYCICRPSPMFRKRPAEHLIDG